MALGEVWWKVDVDVEVEVEEAPSVCVSLCCVCRLLAASLVRRTCSDLLSSLLGLSVCLCARVS